MEDIETFAELVEHQSARTLIMVHWPQNAEDIWEEMILRIQGYLLDTVLPPIRRYQCVFSVIFVAFLKPSNIQSAFHTTPITSSI